MKNKTEIPAAEAAHAAKQASFALAGMSVRNELRNS